MSLPVRLSLLSALLCALFLVVSIPASVSAAVVRSGSTVSVPEDAEVNGDFYAMGNDVNISSHVKGDMYILGGTVTINGQVDGDVVVLGGTVNVHGAVTDDVRVVGGRAIIASDVGSDVVVVSGALSVLSTAHVGGDVLFYGGDATIDGEVKGVVTAHAKSLTVTSNVGSVDASFDKTLSFGDGAHVHGNVAYESESSISRTPNTIIDGAVNHKASSQLADTSPFPTIIHWLIAFFSAFVALFFFRTLLTSLFTQYHQKMALCGLLGLGTLLVVPLAFGLLIITVIGLLAGAVLLLLYLALLAAALMALQLFVGALLAKLIVKQFSVNWIWASVGVVVTQALLMVPILGPLILFSAFTILLGMFVYRGYRSFFAS